MTGEQQFAPGRGINPPPVSRCCAVTVQDTKLESVRRETFTYLGASPQQIHRDGIKAFPAFVLNVGNFLAWISPLLEQGPVTVQPVTDPARSVLALGKQLQELGRELWDSYNSDGLAFRIRAQEKELQANLEHFGKLIETLIVSKGGAK